MKIEYREIHEADFPSYQGKGVGSQLITYAKQKLLKEEIHYLSLTTIRGMPAVEFYEKNGFKQSETVLVMSHSF